MTTQDNSLSKGISKLTTPDEMAEVLRRTYPDDPLEDVPRRQKHAVKRKNLEDIRFWDQVKVLLRG